MDHKTAGLYVNLIKALNALEQAGENLWVQCGDIDGPSGSAIRNAQGEWIIVSS